ncbi:MAG: hypothetical protein QHC67_18275 [Sphingobium sp.]|nr:hypothetical protein [Sphingobium sp.]MDX3911723.1 hypothetical protein [Sphingobium sp.]
MIAAVNGPAMGAANDLACICDSKEEADEALALTVKFFEDHWAGEAVA